MRFFGEITICKIISSIILVSVVIGSVLMREAVTAEGNSGKASASVTVLDACTVQGVGMDSHVATISPNTYSAASGSLYENGIGKTTLKVICNDNDGFSVYAVGYTGNSYDSEEHTGLVGKNTGKVIGTKTYEAGDTVSNWSMKLTAVTDSSESYNPQNLTVLSDSEGSFSLWHSIPDRYTKIAEYHAGTGSSTTDAALGVKLEATYAVFVSSTQPADLYEGQVKYTMVHPYTEMIPQPEATQAGKICYYANASNVEGTMSCQNIATSVTLLASNFSRTGYGFAGWSDRYDYMTNPDVKFYGPQETITLNPADYQAPNNGLSLYAVWIKSAGSMQSKYKIDSLCGTGTSSLTIAPTDGTADLSSVSALTDERDHQTYAIAKLADGQCWMIENLRLDNDAIHNADGSLAEGYNPSFAGLASSEGLAVFNDITTANSVYSTDGTTDETIIGNNLGYRFPRYNNDSTSNRATNPTTNSVALYSYGNYYTWHAVIADTSEYATNNESIVGTSICPAGWRLPTSGGAYGATSSLGVNTTGEPTTFRDYYDLSYKTMDEIRSAYEDTPNKGESYYSNKTINSANKIATNAFRSFPNNFILAGRIDGGKISNRGSSGYYWSSTTGTATSAYYLSLNMNYVYPGTGIFYYKYCGWPVRCVVADVDNQ